MLVQVAKHSLSNFAFVYSVDTMSSCFSVGEPRFARLIAPSDTTPTANRGIVLVTYLPGGKASCVLLFFPVSLPS